VPKASATEDHRLKYLDFEGIIPKGQYGGGTVMVLWDIGTYEVIEDNYYKGWLHLYLSGKKLERYRSATIQMLCRSAGDRATTQDRIHTLARDRHGRNAMHR
jgi:hypothetical protein